MIQVFAHTRDGQFLVARSDEFEASESLFARWPGIAHVEIAWFDLEKPTVEELSWLGSQFHFHPLALEDCMHFDQRPKIDEYADHLFMVLNGLKAGEGDKLVDVYELHCFLAKNLVVTVHDSWIGPIHQLKHKVMRDRKQLPFQEDFLLHKILDHVMDANPQPLQTLETRIEALDEKVLQQDTEDGNVELMLHFHQQLNQARHVLLPQREIFVSILNGEYPAFSERATPYYRDIYDHLLRVIQQVEAHRESLWAIRDAYLAVSSQKANEAMKRLTVFSVVFLPLTFITGFFGMNFERIPWGDSRLFWATLVVIGLLPVGMVFWLARKKWI